MPQLLVNRKHERVRGDGGGQYDSGTIGSMQRFCILEIESPLEVATRLYGKISRAARNVLDWN